MLQRPPPRQIAPQLATSSAGVLPDGTWFFERKLDGIRILTHVIGGEPRLMSRNGHDYTGHFPELVEGLRQQTFHDLIVDGEAVAFEGDLTSFSRLQSRLGARSGPQRRVQTPVFLYAFDLLYLTGHDLRRVPLRDRKHHLEQAVSFGGNVRFTDHVERDGDASSQLLADACHRHWEGLIAKRPDSVYRSGRTGSWRKLPCLHADPFVVGGFTERQGSRTGFGALLLGYHDAASRLRYAGKVGTGFDDHHLLTLRSFLGRIEVPRTPFVDPPTERGVRWVEPIVVVQVTYGQWTPAGRLRQPRFDRVIENLEPTRIVRSTP